MTISTFDEVLNLEEDPARRRVLLGNGFSIACRPDIFRYDALFARAEFADLSDPVRRSFDALETRDFEAVMRGLRTAATLVRVYAAESPAFVERMEEDAGTLREILVRAIADSHPEQPFEIAEEEYILARRFLQHFARIYSLSYDLLLYWTAMQDLEPEMNFDDGFRTPDDGPDEYVTWEVEKTDQQNAFYLHGALHLFDAGHEIKKFTWINTGIRLVDQIRAALKADLFPLIVSEGESREKLARINHSNYLARGYRSFSKLGGALYTFGVAFSDNDDHILDLIRKNRSLRKLFVSVYADPDDGENQRMMEKITQMNEQRTAGGRSELMVRFFDAESARVWTGTVA